MKGSKRAAGLEDCAECNRLWEHFAKTSAELVQLMEEKYSTEARVQPLLDASIRQAIDKRQDAKQKVLAHERYEHPNGGECAVCDGAGKLKEDPSAGVSFAVCANCHGSGIARVRDASSGK